MKVSRYIALILAASLPLTIAGGAFAQQTAEPTEPAPSAANKTSSAAKSSNTEVAETVVIESTITGNQEQPKTIYVLPWQDSVARIKMPAAERPKTDSATKPLDREQFCGLFRLNRCWRQKKMCQAPMPDRRNRQWLSKTKAQIINNLIFENLTINHPTSSTQEGLRDGFI